MYSLKSINVYLLKYKWRLLLGALFVVLSTLFSIYQGVIVRNATNEIVNLIANHTNVNASQFLIFGFTLLALALTSGFFLFLM